MKDFELAMLEMKDQSVLGEIELFVGRTAVRF